MRRQERADRRVRRRTRQRERSERIASAARAEELRAAAAIRAALERSATEARANERRERALADTLRTMSRLRTVDVNLAVAARRARQTALLQQRAAWIERLRQHGQEVSGLTSSQ